MKTDSSIHKFLIKDITGNTFRIFNVIFETDKHGEKFIKFIFPDLAKVNLNKYVSTIHQVDGENHVQNIPHGQLPANVYEYSYHYVGGRGHWKSVVGKDKKYIEVRNDLILDDLIGVTVFRVVLFDLSLNNVYKKKISNEHVFFENTYSGKLLSIEVKLLKKADYNFEFGNRDASLIGRYPKIKTPFLSPLMIHHVAL